MELLTTQGGVRESSEGSIRVEDVDGGQRLLRKGDLSL